MGVVKLHRLSTKIRPVFDASAKNQMGICSNQNLLAGPKTQPRLKLMLTKLRLKPVVLLGDISRCFYALKYLESREDLELTKTDNITDLFRFLWNK